MSGRGRGGRGGRGGGRGGATISLDALGVKPGEVPMTVQPPDTFPPLPYLPLRLRRSAVDDYMLNAMQDYRGSMAESRFYIQKPEQPSRIVRYSDKYENARKLNSDSLKEAAWGMCCRLFKYECHRKTSLFHFCRPQAIS